MLLLSEETDSDLDDSLFSLFVNFLHPFAEVVFQIDGVLPGVNVDLPGLVQRLQTQLLRLHPSLLLDVGTVSRYRDDIALSLQELGRRKIVLEPQLLKISRLASL